MKKSIGPTVRFFGTVLASLATATGVAQADEPTSAGELQIQEITVTARKIAENVQKVPDSISVFTAAAIQDFGVKSIDDFSNLTPNLSFHSGDAYEPGTFAMTLRGIGQTVAGWPGVAFIVDGVPLASSDSIQSGSLTDIERIEVLRGPQSALYGFNAIAGAINIITKKPTNDWHFGTDLIYGNGPDRQVSGVVSGPIVSDTLLFRLTSSYRDFVGLLPSASNGLPLDFARSWQAGGKLLFMPADNLEIDLLATWDYERDGAGYEDKVPDPSYADNFDSGFNARRGFLGEIDRNLYTVASHLNWDFERFSLIGTVSFNHTEHKNHSGACFDDPNDPLLPDPGGGAQCLFGPALGNSAPAGQPIDEFSYESGLYNTVASDVHIASRGTNTVDWTAGAATLHRNFYGGSNLGNILAPDQAQDTLFGTWGAETDRWWGVYGQLIWHMTSRLDFTSAARYDHETYEDTAYTDDSLSVVMPAINSAGVLVNTQHERANAFQPKGQLSYHFTDDDMGYVTVSRGFRAGFFLTNLYTAPEHTTNYEVGFKSMFLDHRVVANAALFYIDYADQQFYQNIDEPPFVMATTIPKTSIKGAELETAVVVSRYMKLGGSLGYLDTNVANGGGWSPGTPRFNLTTYVDFTVPVYQDWNARLHLDDRYNSLQYLGQGNTDENPAKNFLNARLGIQNDRWDIAAFVRNATDRREQTQAGVEVAGGYLRYQNPPRSYGVEVRMSF